MSRRVWSAPATSGRECRQALNSMGASVLQEDVEGAVGITEGTPTMGLFRVTPLGAGIERISLQISDWNHPSQGGHLMRFYLEDFLPQVYRTHLNLQEEFLQRLQRSHQRRVSQMTLSLMGRNLLQHDFQIWGGVALFMGDAEAFRWTLLEELGPEKGQNGVDFLRDEPSQPLLEVGRLAFELREDVSPSLKRRLFLNLLGELKKNIQQQQLVHPHLRVLSFTTPAHIRFYQSLGVRFKTFQQWQDQASGQQRWLGEIEVDSIPNGEL